MKTSETLSSPNSRFNCIHINGLSKVDSAKSHQNINDLDWDDDDDDYPLPHKKLKESDQTSVSSSRLSIKVKHSELSIPTGLQLPSTTTKSYKSFLIEDILKPKKMQSSNSSLDKSDMLPLHRGIVRPWDNLSFLPRLHEHNLAKIIHSKELIRPRSADDDSRSDRSDLSEATSECAVNNNIINQSSPLNALFELTNKALDNINESKSIGESFLCLFLTLFSQILTN